MEMTEAIQELFDSHYKSQVSQQLMAPQEFNLVFSDELIDITSTYASIYELISKAVGHHPENEKSVWQLNKLMNTIIGNYIAELVHLTQPDAVVSFQTGWVPKDQQTFEQKLNSGEISGITMLPADERTPLCSYSIQARDNSFDVTHIEEIIRDDEGNISGYELIDHQTGRNNMPSHMAELFVRESSIRPQSALSLKPHARDIADKINMQRQNRNKSERPVH